MPASRINCGAVIFAAFVLLQQCFTTSAAAAQELRRSYAKRWQDANSFAEKLTHQEAQSFLHKRGQDMMIPIEIDVFLVGFGGYGAYGFYLEPEKLEELISNSLDSHCPVVVELERQSNTCMQISYQVTNLKLQDKDPRQALYELEDALRHSMQAIHLYSTQPGQDMYEVDAFNVEHVYDRFVQDVYGGEDVVSERKPWHKHNAIFIVNPSKERMNPRNNATGRQEPLNVLNEWKKGDFNMQKLQQMEAGYSYSYNYYGHGHSSVFISSSNYVVIDVSAGPTKFGPVVSPAGGVSETSVPRLQALYQNILSQLASIKQVTGLEQAVNLAEQGQRLVYEGQVTSLLASAVRHVFIPDLLFDRTHPSKRLLVPVIVLRDHDIVDPLDSDLQHHHGYEVDVDSIELAVRSLADPQQQVVVTSISHYLHQHPALAAAVQKSMHTVAKPSVNPNGGLDVEVHTYLDSSIILSEFSLAADMLSYGLLEAHMQDAAQDMQQQWEADAAEYQKHYLRQRLGTRVLPIFILSLKNSAQNLVLDHGGLVAADKEAIIVLQLLNPKDGEGLYTAGVFSGHMIQNEAVQMDSVDVTRHIVAGLGASVAGLLPTYQRWDPMSKQLVEDWRWAVGAIPYGPYSAFSAVNSIMMSLAQRNRLLTQVDTLAKDLTYREERLDELIEQHVLGPLGFVVDEDDEEHKRKIDILAVDHTTFTYDPDTGMAVRNNSDTVTQQLQRKMDDLETHLSTLSYSLFDHSFDEVDKHLDELYKVADTYTSEVDVLLATVDEKLRCCKIERHRGMNPWWVLAFAIGGIVGMLVLALTISALVSKMQRKQRYKSDVFKL